MPEQSNWLSVQPSSVRNLAFSFEFLSAIIESFGDDMTALQDAARPRIAGMAVWAGKFAFRVVEVLMQDLAIGLDRDAALLAVANCDAAFFPPSNAIPPSGSCVG
jgi:hypothetical protein